METLSTVRWQQLCLFHSLQCVSRTQPMDKISGFSSGTVGLVSHMRTQCFPSYQLGPRKSGTTLMYLTDSNRLLQNVIRPLSWRQADLSRGRCFPPMKGYFLDVRCRTTCGLESWKFDSSRTKRQVWSLATPGDGSSVHSSDSTSDEKETIHDSTSSSLNSSLKPTWLSKLEQADWNKLIFNWRKDEPMWAVPWTGQTIFQVMVLWFAAFWIMGSWVIPIAAQIAGFSRHSLTFRGQALYSLITDIAEGTVGIWILKLCLARFLPLPNGWFPVKWRGKWLVEACWGCLLFPFVNQLSQLNLYLVPLPNLTTSYVEQSMMSRDPVATLLYAVVISVCAPVWEEVIFRGFLLPSMTRYMPLWGAIFVSALAFATAHFSMQRILPLTFLGLVMGFVFVRSKNLLASIVLHSLWNGFAFLELI